MTTKKLEAGVKKAAAKVWEGAYVYTTSKYQRELARRHAIAALPKDPFQKRRPS